MSGRHCSTKLCDGCSDRLRALLDASAPEAGAPLDTWSVPELYDALSATPGTTGDGGPSSTKPGPRSPADDSVLSLTDTRSSALEGGPGSPAAVIAYGARMLGVWGALSRLSFRARCRYLHGSAAFIAAESWGAGFLELVEKSHRQLRYALGDKRPTKIGTCFVCGFGLFAPQAGEVVECPTCNERYDASAQVELALAEIIEKGTDGYFPKEC